MQLCCALTTDVHRSTLQTKHSDYVVLNHRVFVIVTSVLFCPCAPGRPCRTILALSVCPGSTPATADYASQFVHMCLRLRTRQHGQIGKIQICCRNSNIKYMEESHRAYTTAVLQSISISQHTICSMQQLACNGPIPPIPAVRNSLFLIVWQSVQADRQRGLVQQADVFRGRTAAYPELRNICV